MQTALQEYLQGCFAILPAWQHHGRPAGYSLYLQQPGRAS